MGGLIIAESTDTISSDNGGGPPEGYITATFQADSALIRELGERLVGQPHIALAELIKNAYDADATTCIVTLGEDQITVSDNGNGMSRDEFLRHWMTIGTRNKQERGQTPKFGRNVTGSKGVGRLSAQFLAHELEIFTTSEANTAERLSAIVDWDRAIDAGQLTQAKAFYNVASIPGEYAGGSPHGTSVVMKRLKQRWGETDIRDLGRQLWMIQAPTVRYGNLASNTVDPNAFRVTLKSWRGDIEDAFAQQMSAALRNYDALITGELKREGDKALVHVTVKFTRGETFSESFEEPGLIDAAKWSIRVFKLAGRQYEGIKVSDARTYFEKFGGVQVYDAGFRLPYYGVEQDWLDIEYDHSHRRNKSALLPDRLHVRRALNDLPTQGRLFGVVGIDTGREARSASAEEQDSGEYLKIQVTRDRLVANEAYELLRKVVRWSLDYYATRERLREEATLDLTRPSEPAAGKASRAAELVRQLRRDHPHDENVASLESEISDLAATIEDEARADDAARTLLGPLAAAGMAALALEHENRKELRLARGLVSRLKSLAKSYDPERLISLSDQLEAWLNRLESTRRIFAPLLDAEDREQIETLSAGGVLRQVIENVRPLIPGISVTVDVPADFNLPPATFAEWHSLFQNVLVNAANATLDSVDRRIMCSAGRTGRSAWIRVSDTGSGLDWQNSSELFEPFNRRMTVSDERKGLGLGGMGLGLTIVRMMAEQRRCVAQFVQPEPPWSTTFQLSWSSTL